MLLNAFVVLLISLQPLLALSSFKPNQDGTTAAVGDEKCKHSETELETLWKQNDTSWKKHCTVSSEKRLILKKEISKANSKITPADEQFEYQFEVSSDKEILSGLTIIANTRSNHCNNWQPTGWLSQSMDPNWNVTHCKQGQYVLLQVAVQPQHNVKLTWMFSCDILCSYDVTVTASDKTVPRKHNRSTRATPRTQSSPYILLANRYFLHQLTLDGNREKTVVSDPRGNIYAVDYHYRMGRLFWSDYSWRSGRIMMSNLDGSQPTAILNQELNTRSIAISIDWINDKLYYIDASRTPHYIGVLDIITTMFKKLIIGASQSRLHDIIVDPTTRWLYWSDYYHNTIEKASMNGRNRTIVIDTNVPETYCLTLDYQQQTLYWFDRNYRKLESSSVDGTNRRTVYLFSNTYSHNGLSLLHGTLFLSRSSQLFSISTTGQNFTSINNAFTCRTSFSRLKILSEDRQPQTTSNPCGIANGGCSHLCLVSAVDPEGYSCDCPFGMSLSSDRRNCTGRTSVWSNLGSCLVAGYSNSCCASGNCLGSPANCHCDANCRLFDDCCSDVPQDCKKQELTEYIMIADQKFIHRTDIVRARSDYRLQTPISNLKNAMSLDYHYRKNHLFWTDVYNNSLFIWRSNLDNGSDAVPLIDTGASATHQYVDIAVDWVTDKIYWTNTNHIMVHDLQRGYQTTLINSTDSGVFLHQVVVDPRTSTLYWSDIGTHPKVGKCSLDGSANTTILNSSRYTDNIVFTLDRTNQELYWIKGRYSCYLERSNTDGSNKSIVFNATYSQGGCYYDRYYYMNTPQSIDYFGGAVYTHSIYNRYNRIYRTTTDRRSISTTSNYVNYLCGSSLRGTKVISRQRQLQSYNPCANNNGGCAHLCLLSSTHPDGYTCACHTGSTLQSNKRGCFPDDPRIQAAEDIRGSCSAAGYSSCCVSGKCMGTPANCYCDRLCHTFTDCCVDARTLCRPTFNRSTSMAELPTQLSFIDKPANETVIEYEGVELHCMVCSTLTPAFSWKFTRKGSEHSIVDAHNPLTPDYLIKLGERSQVLIIREAEWKYEGVYKCIVSSDSNTVQAEANLSVLVPARNIDVEGSIAISEGLSLFTVECSVVANPSASIVWFKTSSGEELTNTSRMSITHRFTSDSAPISYSTLNISATESDDYMCLADNDVADAVSLNFSLIKTGQCNCIRTYKGNKCLVEGQSTDVLVFITRPQDTTAVDGHFVEFQCSACSTLETTITWTFTRKGSQDSEEINDNSTLSGDYSLIPGENSLTLIINSVNWTHEGLYECTISTENREIYAEADLIIQIPANEVEIRGNTNTPDEQQTLVLQCSVIANPPARIHWSKDNEPLYNNSRISITYQFNSTQEPTVTSILTIHEITTDDGGDYICAAENDLKFDHVYANFSVFVTELPPAPVEIQTFCTVVIWRNALNTSYDDIIGYNVRLVNSATNDYNIHYVDASATFYSLDPVDSEDFNFVQVQIVTATNLGLFSHLKSLECHQPVLVLKPPVDVEASCIIVTWHNSPNTSYDDVIGYDVRLINLGTHLDVIRHVDASSTFYSLHPTDDAVFKSESTFVQVRAVSVEQPGIFSPVKSLGCQPSGSFKALNECVLYETPCRNGGVCIGHTGGYTCKCVGNFQGTYCDEEVPENMTALPEIKEPPETTVTDLGAPINLTCTASGHPTPIYEWYKDGELVVEATKSFLYFSEPLPENRGNYTCKAINNKGVMESNPATLDIKGIVQYAAILNSSDVTDGVVALQELAELISLKNAYIYEITPVTINTTSNEIVLLITVRLLAIEADATDTTTQTLRLNLLITLKAILTVINFYRYDGCEPEVFHDINWPETTLGDTASAPCPCTEFAGSLAGRAHRYCGGTFSRGGRWEEHADIGACSVFNSDTTKRLCEAAQSGNFTYASKVAVEVTSMPEALTPADISTSTSIVLNLLAEEALHNSKVRDDYLQIISNIQEADSDHILTSQKETQSSSKLLKSLGNFMDQVELGNMSNNQTVFAFKTYALQVQDRPDSSEYKAQTFKVDLGTVEEATQLQMRIKENELMTVDGFENGTNTTASIHIPEDLLGSYADLDSCSNLTTNSYPVFTQRLSYSLFLSDVLFQNINQSHMKIGSVIVAARLKCANNLTLNTPIKTTFQINREVEANSSSSACSMWQEEGFGAWSTSGCREVTQRDGQSRVCECTQLAHFGILFDLSPKPPISYEGALALSIITYVGLIISLVCLIVFVISYLMTKKLRTSTHGQILINLSLALMGVYIFFLIAGHVTSIPILCAIVSALLHYFLLVFFGWTAVEASLLYLKLVKVFGVQSATSKFALKAGILTWVIPLVMVTVCAGTASKYYVNPFYCRATEWPFWIGMIVPFLAVTLYNWIMFVLIMVSIFGHTTRPVAGKDKPRWKLMRTNFTIAVTLAVMFGLGWALGLVATSLPVKKLTFAFQILFSIFVGAQGVLIFLLHGIRNQDIRKLWVSLFPISLVTSFSKSSSIIKSHITGGQSSRVSSLANKKEESGSAEQNIYIEKPVPVVSTFAMEMESTSKEADSEGDQCEKTEMKPPGNEESNDNEHSSDNMLELVNEEQGSKMDDSTEEHTESLTKGQGSE